MDDPAETGFFHYMAPAVLKAVKDMRDVTIAEDKGPAGDYSTQVDIRIEELIVAELRKRFPDDGILAEEGRSDTRIDGGRVWLIDPICGTNNLGKGISNFSTNIALADGREVIAACVVDHAQGAYIWSVGYGEVFVGSRPYTPPSDDMGTKVDVDFGSVRNVDKALRLRHGRFVSKLLEETDFDIVSLNTSLAFAYAAIGKLDGFVNVFNHPWDIAAAGFLLRQSGGLLTGLDGSAWTVDTVGAIGGRSPEFHKRLLEMFRAD